MRAWMMASTIALVKPLLEVAIRLPGTPTRLETPSSSAIFQRFVMHTLLANKDEDRAYHGFVANQAPLSHTLPERMSYSLYGQAE
jgi:hypothetical protein